MKCALVKVVEGWIEKIWNYGRIEVKKVFFTINSNSHSENLLKGFVKALNSLIFWNDAHDFFINWTMIALWKI